MFLRFTDFIPTFLLNLYRKSRIRKSLGENNVCDTLWVSNDVKLGKEVYLAHDVDVRDNVEIGDYSYVSPNSVIFSGSKIGKFCSIGYAVQIGLPEHPMQFLSTSSRLYRNVDVRKHCVGWNERDIFAPPVIENDVWIGSHVCILQGVHIGTGAVIAAGAVVVKDVPAYAVVGGVPAKVIKYRFGEEHIEKLLKSEWWNRDFKWIERHYDELMIMNARGKV